MHVQRRYHDRPLQLDVNLLISEFPTALADALDRVFVSAMAMAPKTSDGQGLVEAQAG
jgi:hypothetical protein